MNGKENKSQRGKSARRRGHDFERYLVSLLQELGYQSVTSRAGSLELDNQGIDILTEAPFNIQAKFVERLSPGAHEILAEMKRRGVNPQRANVLAHKRANKGIVISMDLETFVSLCLPRLDQKQGLTESELGLPGREREA